MRGSRKLVYELFDKLLQIGVQSGDYANNGGYDDSDCDNKNSRKMVIHQLIEMKDLMNHLHR